MPRIILVTHTLEAGGAERVVADLACRLPSLGCAVEVVTVLGTGSLEDELRACGIPVTHLRRHGFLGFGTVKDLVRLFREKRPDVVHTHLFLADFWGRIAARLARVPAVVTTDHNVNVTYRRSHRFVNRALVPLTDRFVAVSDAVAEDMRGHGIPDAKIITIRNGIDVSRFAVRPRLPFSATPRLLAVGRLAEQKGYGTLLAALANVREPWRLRVAGIGTLERDLRRAAERLGIAGKIEWLGARRDVPALLAASDLFCFPSHWEGLGLAVMEAAVAGIPIIASDLPALRELFADGDITFVPSEDVSGWAAALSYALSHGDEMIERADCTMTKARATFDVSRMVTAYAEMYREMAGRRVGS